MSSPWDDAADAVRARWRNVDELLGAPADERDGPDVPPERGGIRRRELLELMGASLALASSCTQAPRERIVPAAGPAAPVGAAVWYASAAVRDGVASGILVETHGARPTKIEGNARHATSLGKTSAFEQALLLALYDPKRARTVTASGAASSFDAFTKYCATLDVNARLHVALRPTSSLVTQALLAALQARFRNSAVHFIPRAWSPSNAWAGAATMCGRAADVAFDLSRASTVICLDADLFADGPAAIRAAHDFAARRREHAALRLFTVDEGATLTSQRADQRLAIKPSRVALIAGALADELAPSSSPSPRPSSLSDAERGVVAAIVRTVQRDPTGTAIVVGARQPASVHAAALDLMQRLGSLGVVARPVEPVLVDAGNASHDVLALGDGLARNEVDALVALDVSIAQALPHASVSAVPVRIEQRERASPATWFIPLAHPLESWGDARGHDGTRSAVQPVIEPLWGARTVDETLAALTGVGDGPRALLKRSFAAHGFVLEDALRAGVVDGSAAPAISSAAAPNIANANANANANASASASASGIELSLRPDLKIGAGLEECAWLLELPDPLTSLTWENAALISPRTAAALGVVDGSVVALTTHDGSVDMPIAVLPGHADDVITVHTGWGESYGTNARILAALHDVGVAVTIANTGRTRELAMTQTHHRLDSGSDEVARVVAAGGSARKKRSLATLYDPPVRHGPQWGMAIDLDACTGCGACVVACQAENNVPVVGRDGVLMHREMHWLRIDRYFIGDAVAPRVIHQPMLCQHCEMAPC
ncbi:MAG TPA: molybdopterin dinucleotide binding domain-containing protein, partial [Myxococcota bacterium]